MKFLLICIFESFIVSFMNAVEYDWFIRVPKNDCFDETCYTDIEDYANSPLVECSFLPEEFYECLDINDKNSSFNCSKWGGSKYSEVDTTNLPCTIHEGIECRGNRTFEITVPCIRYTDKYFISTLLYSIFLGLFAVDRFCIGHTGIGVGKLITLGGIGVWWIIDIILLVLGYVKPSDNSNWVPFF